MSEEKKSVIVVVSSSQCPSMTTVLRMCLLQTLCCLSTARDIGRFPSQHQHQQQQQQQQQQPGRLSVTLDHNKQASMLSLTDHIITNDTIRSRLRSPNHLAVSNIQHDVVMFDKINSDRNHSFTADFNGNTSEASISNVSINAHVITTSKTQWVKGGHTYMIIMLSALVLLAIVFTLCGLFHKAEAHQSKTNPDDGLLFDGQPTHTSMFEVPPTTSML